MKVALLADGYTYNPYGRNKFNQIDMNVEDAIKKYAGIGCLMLTWEEDDDLLCHTVINLDMKNNLL